MQHALYSFKPGIQNYSQQIQCAKELGIPGIEYLANLELRTASIEKGKRLKEEMDEAALFCPCFSMWISMMNRTVKESVDLIKGYIDMAEIMGAPYFHHTVGPRKNPQQTFSQYLEVANTVIRETYDYAAEKGMLVLIEPQGHMMNGVSHLREFYGTVDRPVGAVLDTGNILESTSTNEEYLAEFAPLVRHVHLKDVLLKPHAPDSTWDVCVDGSAQRQTIMGHGVINFDHIFRMLKDVGYHGWYSLEYVAPEEWNAGFAQSVKNTKAMYDRHFDASWETYNHMIPIGG